MCVRQVQVWGVFKHTESALRAELIPPQRCFREAWPEARERGFAPLQHSEGHKTEPPVAGN